MQRLYDLISNNLFWFLVFPYLIAGILIIFMIIYRKDKTHSISKFVATSSHLASFFAVFLSLGSIPVYLTLAFYLIPKYNVHPMMSILIIPIYISQTILACIPDKKDSKSSIHIISAFICGFLLVIFCALMCLLGTMNFTLKAILIQFVLVCAVLFTLLLFNNKIKKYAFNIELIFLIDWVTTIFTLAFIE